MIATRIFKCEACGAEKVVRAALNDQRFCSISCAKTLERHPMWKGGGGVTAQGYYRIATGTGSKLLHVALAEKALGHPLPPGAQVHHVDEVRSHNWNSNLVICESRAYHSLLHARMRIVAVGGDPHVHKICSLCRKEGRLFLKALSEFHKDKNSHDGLLTYCKACNNAHVARYHRKAATEITILAKSSIVTELV